MRKINDSILVVWILFNSSKPGLLNLNGEEILDFTNLMVYILLYLNSKIEMTIFSRVLPHFSLISPCISHSLSLLICFGGIFYF